jgi:hypothetical protein
MNTEDINLAYKVRHALNANLDNIPAATAERLASARKLAVSRKKAHAPARVAQRALAGNIDPLFSFPSLGRVGALIPLLALVAGLAGIYQYEQKQHIAEIAELDAAVLSDELPLTAYMDHGFNAYLAQRGQ